MHLSIDCRLTLMERSGEDQRFLVTFKSLITLSSRWRMYLYAKGNLPSEVISNFNTIRAIAPAYASCIAV